METDTQQPEKPQEKIKTAFSALHQSMGADKDNIELIIPTLPAQQQAAPAAQQQAKTEEQQAAPAAQQNSDIDIDGLSDEKRNELLSKLTKGKITNIEDLTPPVEPTAEELAKAKEKLRANALTWAIDNGKVKQSDYERTIVDKSKTDRELALAAFTANLRENDKDIKDEEAEELFKDAYHEEADEKSKIYTIGQGQIKKLADAYRKENFSNIDNIEPEYNEFLQTENQYKGYKTIIKKIAAELPKEMSVDMPYKNVDGSETTLFYKIPVDEKVVNKLLADYNAQKSFVMRNIANEGKIDEKVISQEMNYHLKAMMFDHALPQMMEQHGNKMQELLMVELGNKRASSVQLNDGRQNTTTAAPKKNEYSALHAATKK